jgi:hypothetical protein
MLSFRQFSPAQTMSGNDKQRDRGRTEPTLGNLDQLGPALPPPPAVDDLPRVAVDAPRRPRAPASPPSASRRHWLLPALLVLVIVAIVLAWANQDRLRALLPRTDLNTTLTQADQALAAGDLDGNDGRSARELYASALAREPDNDQARAGLQKVGQAELARAGSAIQAGRYSDAEDAIAAARALLGGGSDVDRATQALAGARHSKTANDALIGRAQQALAAGKLSGKDGAAVLFRQALDADPDNAVARHGLDQVGDALAAQARTALQGGDRAGAAATVDAIGRLLPRYGELPALRASLAQAQKQSDATVQQYLQQGEADLRAGRFTGAGDDNALAHYRAALAIDPDNAQARAGLGQVAQALVLRANAAMDADDPAQAGTLLGAAAALAPKSADLATAQARLHELKDGQAAAAAQPALTPAQQAKVAQLLQRAQAAAKAGDIMLPPGASAYDLYREALAIDADSQPAQDGLQGLPARTRALFDKALGSGDLQRAEGFLATLDDLAPGDTAQAALRRRLADAWLDRAERNLDQGDVPGARRSLDAARELRPNAPRLQELDARVRGGP